jgi:hypothetical protein
MDLKNDVSMTPRSTEKHRAGRTGWLRAAVLGANDGTPERFFALGIQIFQQYRIVWRHRATWR